MFTDITVLLVGSITVMEKAVVHLKRQNEVFENGIMKIDTH